LSGNSKFGDDYHLKDVSNFIGVEGSLNVEIPNSFKSLRSLNASQNLEIGPTALMGSNLKGHNAEEEIYGVAAYNASKSNSFNVFASILGP